MRRLKSFSTSGDGDHHILRACKHVYCLTPLVLDFVYYLISYFLRLLLLVVYINFPLRHIVYASQKTFSDSLRNFIDFCVLFIRLRIKTFCIYYR